MVQITSGTDFLWKHSGGKFKITTFMSWIKWHNFHQVLWSVYYIFIDIFHISVHVRLQWKNLILLNKLSQMGQVLLKNIFWYAPNSNLKNTRRSVQKQCFMTKLLAITNHLKDSNKMKNCIRSVELIINCITENKWLQFDIMAM